MWSWLVVRKHWLVIESHICMGLEPIPSIAMAEAMARFDAGGSPHRRIRNRDQRR